jgi:hypothetical protein
MDTKVPTETNETKTNATLNNVPVLETGASLISGLLNSLLICCSYSNSNCQLIQLCGSIIGLIGICDPFEINGHDAHLFKQISQQMSINISNTTHYICPPFSSTFTEMPIIAGGVQIGHPPILPLSAEQLIKPSHTILISMLAQLLQYSDSNIISLSYQLLFNIFVSVKLDAQAAYQMLDISTQAYLYPFYHIKCRSVRVISPYLLEESADLLWSPLHKTFLTWICPLSFYLCNTFVRDGILNLCARMCVENGQFAARAFPYIIYSMLYEKDIKIATQLVQMFNQLVKQKYIQDNYKQM